jgi:hypothetical protein
MSNVNEQILLGHKNTSFSRENIDTRSFDVTMLGRCERINCDRSIPPTTGSESFMVAESVGKICQNVIQRLQTTIIPLTKGVLMSTNSFHVRIPLLVVLGLVSLVTFYGCGSTKLFVSNTLPSTMQQNIKTGVSKQISFSFADHPQANEVNLDIGPMWSCSYFINQPFRGMLTDLLESKYGHIDEKAPNKVSITITKFEQTLDKGGISDGFYSMALAVEVQVNKDGKKDIKRFSYDIGVPLAYGFTDANKVFHNKLAESVKELLVKFTVSIDKYLDSFEM